MAEIQKTTLNPRWVAKIVISTLVVFAFGMWCLADAAYFYPRRGLHDASFKQLQYLKQAEQVGLLDSASIPDPQARHATLATRRAELEKTALDWARLEQLSSGSTDAARQARLELRRLETPMVEARALEWLDSLRRVGRLERDMTTMPAPRDTMAELRAKWDRAEAPNPLSSYDLPLQWLMFTACMAIPAYLVFFVLIPASRKIYTWDADTRRLTLPGGRSITPADVAEFDKRKWDKLYIVLHLKGPAHGDGAGGDGAGGGEVTLDLLRHKHLEEWVLEMEREAFPQSAPPPEAEGALSPPGVDPGIAGDPASPAPSPDAPPKSAA